MIVLEWLFLTIAPCDAAEPWQLGSQDAASPMMQGIMDLHHDIFFFLILILVFVLFLVTGSAFFVKFFLLRIFRLHMESKDTRARAKKRLREKRTHSGSGSRGDIPEDPEDPKERRKKGLRIIRDGLLLSVRGDLRYIYEKVNGVPGPTEPAWQKAVCLYLGLGEGTDNEAYRVSRFQGSLRDPLTGQLTDTDAFHAVYKIVKDLM